MVRKPASFIQQMMFDITTKQLTKTTPYQKADQQANS
jgi:hypothetical protein